LDIALLAVAVWTTCPTRGMQPLPLHHRTRTRSALSLRACLSHTRFCLCRSPSIRKRTAGGLILFGALAATAFVIRRSFKRALAHGLAGLNWRWLARALSRGFWLTWRVCLPLSMSSPQNAMLGGRRHSALVSAMRGSGMGDRIAGYRYSIILLEGASKAP